MEASLSYMVNVVVVPIICVFGTFGNVLSFLVLRKSVLGLRTTRMLLRTLAVADSAYLFTCIFMQTLNTLLTREARSDEPWKICWLYMYAYVWPVASTVQTAVVYLVVAVSADRYTAICHPFSTLKYSSPSRTRKIIICICAASLVYNMPRFFTRRVALMVPSSFDDTSLLANATSLDQQQWNHNFTVMLNATTPVSSNRTLLHDHHYETSNSSSVELLVAMKTPLRSSKLYFLWYKTISFSVFRVCIPFTCLTYFNAGIIKAIRTSNYSHRERRFHQRRGSMVLVAVVLVFIICTLPSFTLRVAVMMWNWFGNRRVQSWIAPFNHVANMLLAVNSSVNFLIYCFMGKQFRNTVYRLLSCQINQHTV